MKTDKIPKIFISYSWSSDTLVLPLAERLVSHGVDVILDKWDLKEGQDKYAFMEQCVKDPDIDKVLIVCDKKYQQKANSREGGVGDETAIISTEVYGKVRQEKFIPIIAEHDEEGEPCVPIYIKSRIYIDLSDTSKYEEEYEKLLRNIYNKPTYKKPTLGNKPEWLEEDKVNCFPLQDLLRQIKGALNEQKQTSLVQKFKQQYTDILKEYYKKGTTTPQEVFHTYISTKGVRDYYLDFLDVLLETNINLGEFLCDFFEDLFNTLIYVKTFSEKSISYAESEFDSYKCLIWEMFICTIAFLRYHKMYDTINKILTNTYFLRNSPFDEKINPTNYSHFRHHSRIIEEQYKPTTDKKNKFTLLGDVIYNEREKLPIYSKEAIAQADLFLYQVFNAMKVTIDENYRPFDTYWFPTMYIYTTAGVTEWEKLKSKKYCEKMFPLFNVTNIEDLKTAIKECIPERDMGYRSYYFSAPSILSCIKIDEIGTLN